MVDRACEEAWDTELFSLQLFESPAGNARRAAVISWLDGLIGGVSALIGAEQGLTVAEAAIAGSRVLPFGSYREGVHSPQSDLDLLALCPVHVSREAFFALVPALLIACSRESGASAFAPTFVQALPDAYVPVIKLGVGGLQVDLLYARIPLSRLPPALLGAVLDCASPLPLDRSAAAAAPAASSSAGAPAPLQLPPLLGVLDDALARRLAAEDPKSGLSLNGVRVTERILASLPAPADLRAFQVWGRNGYLVDSFLAACARAATDFPLSLQIALVALKTWAKARGLYGHVLGYPGGVAWAIIVATVAQVRPMPGGPGGRPGALRRRRFSVWYPRSQAKPGRAPLALLRAVLFALTRFRWGPAAPWRLDTAVPPPPPPPASADGTPAAAMLVLTPVSPSSEPWQCFSLSTTISSSSPPLPAQSTAASMSAAWR